MLCAASVRSLLCVGKGWKQRVSSPSRAALQLFTQSLTVVAPFIVLRRSVHSDVRSSLLHSHVRGHCMHSLNMFLRPAGSAHRRPQPAAMLNATVQTPVLPVSTALDRPLLSSTSSSSLTTTVIETELDESSGPDEDMQTMAPSAARKRRHDEISKDVEAQ